MLSIMENIAFILSKQRLLNQFQHLAVGLCPFQAFHLFTRQPFYIEMLQEFELTLAPTTPVSCQPNIEIPIRVLTVPIRRPT